MYEHRFLQVMHARNAADLKHSLVAFAAHHEFPVMCGFIAMDRPAALTEFIPVDNLPSGFEVYADDDDRCSIDVVMQHCKVSSLPIMFDMSTYIEAGQEHFWQQSAQFGFETGLSVAVHLPQGRHFNFSMHRAKPLPKRRDQLTRLLCELQLMAVVASDTAFRTLVTPDQLRTTVKLTPQELRCLQWTATGLTAFAVGEKLNISQRTAVKHLHNAMHKLGCSGKHQAAMAAARAGLITL